MIIKKEDCKLVSLTRRICQRFTDFYIIENKGKIVSAAVFLLHTFVHLNFDMKVKWYVIIQGPVNSLMNYI